MLTLMSPPLGLGKRCPSKVAYKVDQPFLLWGLEPSRSRGSRELREVGLGGAGEALVSSNMCLARSWGSPLCSEESWPCWLVSTAHARDAAVVTVKPGEVWGGRPQWERRGRVGNSVEVGGLEKTR